MFHVIFDDKTPGAGDHFAKTFSLHRFLMAHKGEPDLHKRVLRKGKPLFTAAEMRQALKGLRVQRGGAAPKAATGASVPEATPAATATAATATAATATAANAPKNTGPAVPAGTAVGTAVKAPTSFSAGTTVFDKVLNKLVGLIPGMGAPGTSPCSESLDTCLKQFPTLPGVGLFFSFLSICTFLLYHLETDIPIVGPAFISPALDTITLGLPATSEVIESLLQAAGPVPGLGAAALFISMFVGSILAVIATLMNLSRKQFGSAFQTSLSIIPNFGDALTEIAQQTETFLKRLQERFDRVVAPVRELSPTAGKVAYLEAPLSIDTADKIKNEAMFALEQKANENPAVAKALQMAKALTEQLSKALPPEVMEKLKDNDLMGATREVYAIAALPPNEFLKKVGVPPEVETLAEKGIKAATNAKNAAVTIGSAVIFGAPDAAKNATNAKVSNNANASNNKASNNATASTNAKASNNATASTNANASTNATATNNATASTNATPPNAKASKNSQPKTRRRSRRLNRRNTRRRR
jgi:hypothetical protein